MSWWRKTRQPRSPDLPAQAGHSSKSASSPPITIAPVPIVDPGAMLSPDPLDAVLFQQWARFKANNAAATWDDFIGHMTRVQQQLAIELSDTEARWQRVQPNPNLP